MLEVIITTISVPACCCNAKINKENVNRLTQLIARYNIDFVMTVKQRKLLKCFSSDIVVMLSDVLCRNEEN